MSEELLDDAFVHARLVCTFLTGPAVEYARLLIILDLRIHRKRG
jgi:hypothetical protein